MVLEFHAKLSVTEPDFMGKFILPQKLGKGTKIGQFLSTYWKIWSLIFTESDL